MNQTKIEQTDLKRTMKSRTYLFDLHSACYREPGYLWDLVKLSIMPDLVVHSCSFLVGGFVYEFNDVMSCVNIRCYARRQVHFQRLGQANSFSPGFGLVVVELYW